MEGEVGSLLFIDTYKYNGGNAGCFIRFSWVFLILSFYLFLNSSKNGTSIYVVNHLWNTTKIEMKKAVLFLSIIMSAMAFIANRLISITWYQHKSNYTFRHCVISSAQTRQIRACPNSWYSIKPNQTNMTTEKFSDGIFPRSIGKTKSNNGIAFQRLCREFQELTETHRTATEGRWCNECSPSPKKCHTVKFEFQQFRDTW